MSRDIKRTSKGISFVDVDHIFYAETIIAKKRREEGRSLKSLTIQEAEDRPCFICWDSEADGDWCNYNCVGDEGKEVWLCLDCIDKDERSKDA